VRRRIRLDFSWLKRRWPALAAVVVASALLGWLVVRSASVSAFARNHPRVAAVVAPDDPRVTVGLVMQHLRVRLATARPDSRSLLTPRLEARSRQALVRAPLAEEPLLVEGIEELIRRDDRRAREAIGHALARNPRSRLARLFMLELELRAGDSRGAAADMTILSRLLPDSQKVFVPELARLAQDPRTRETLRQSLATDPSLHGRVLHYLASRDADPRLVLRLAGDNPPPPGDAGDWRRTLLDSLVRRNRLQEARQLWAAFAGMDPGRELPLVYDGDFRGHPGLSPFNWSLHSSEIGAAEREKAGGLLVEYYGRARGELATQLVTLPPGRYRMTFYAEGDLNTPQHRLIWRMQCNGTDRQIMEFPLANITYAGRRLAGDFNVPEGCPAQWLRLVGEPTEFPKIENVLIRNLGIQRIGNAA